MYNVFVQAVGVLGMVFGVLSYQCNTHKKIMIFKTISEFSFAVQFFLLNKYTGMAMNVIGCVRNIVFAVIIAKKKSPTPCIIVFAVLMITAGALTWAGAISLLAIIGKTSTNFSYGMSNPKLVRLLTIPSCSCWFTYDLLSNSIAGAVLEGLGLISIAVGYFRYDFKNRKKEKVQEGSESETVTNENDEEESEAAR